MIMIDFQKKNVQCKRIDSTILFYRVGETFGTEAIFHFIETDDYLLCISRYYCYV